MTEKVNAGDMLYVQAADADIRLKGESGGAVTALMKFMLRKGKIDAAIAMGKGKDVYDGVPRIITDPERITEVSGSIRCAPLLFSKFVYKYLNGARDARLCIVGVGCDVTAVRKIAEKGGIDSDNIVLIGLNCRGTVWKKGKDEEGKKSATSQETLVKGAQQYAEDPKEAASSRRSSCLRCEIKVPRNADIACGYWGVIGPEAGRFTFVEVCSEKGAKLINEAIEAKAINVKQPPARGVEVRLGIEKSMLRLAEDWQKKDVMNPEERDSYWLGQFAKCIKCMGCVRVCPVCLCPDCKLVGTGFNGLERNRQPVSPRFQYIRSAHIAGDCINCGQCDDICPVEIPLSTFYRQASKDYQKLFAKFDEIVNQPEKR